MYRPAERFDLHTHVSFRFKEERNNFSFLLHRPYKLFPVVSRRINRCTHTHTGRRSYTFFCASGKSQFSILSPFLPSARQSSQHDEDCFARILDRHQEDDAAEGFGRRHCQERKKERKKMKT